MRIIFFIVLLMAGVGCQKEFSVENGTSSSQTLPVITTATVTSITDTTAISGGNISSDGGAAIIARGVCWSIVPNPVITGSHTQDGTGMGSFISNITSLTPGITYHVRAYATNSVGTAYGGDSLFTSLPGTASLPILTTKTITAISSDTAVGGGIITSDGGASITARGVCWGISPNPVITGSHTQDGTGTGSFNSAMTGLSSSTTYHVRAYATNSVGTSYGGDSMFTTLPDIYVGGFENNNAAIRVAKIWKNGIPVSLSNGSSDAAVFSVYVAGADVYAVGYELQIGPSGLTHYAKLWKNGVATTLGSDMSEANSVFVAGTDVYVAGFESNGSRNVARLWKNGIPSSLTNGLTNATALSVFVAGTDVYVAGKDNDGFMAKVWKNGVATILSNGAGGGCSASSVFVKGADVFVAGYETSGLGGNYAQVWKNGIATPLTNGLTYSEANAVFVANNNDVYVAGFESIAGTVKGKVWKNTIASVLVGNNTTGQSIQVLNGDVYVAGTADLTSVTSANIWKNGVATTLSNIIYPAEAYSVFVK